ncbi:MAG: hypothetical protein C0620_14410 [Desulfuromonas sp.]|nr:MAG: hypothetical protein C0620_14410 [Desulfuromonas sp.]
MKTCLTVLFCLALAWSVQASGIYHYRDASGRLIVVDDPDLIPEQYASRQVEAPTTSGISSEDSPVAQSWEITIEEQEEDGEIITPVEIIHNQVVVPVTLQNNRKELTVHLVVDTGATISLLDQEMVRLLRLKKVRSAKAHLADGSTLTVDIARLASLSVGPLQVNQVQVALVEREKGIRIGDGLLGMNVLKHRPHRIDYQQKCIIWEARD